MSQYLIYGIGFLAQLLFSGRLLVQWVASERAKKVLSPVLFWQLSILASFMLCLYGWLRNDFAIIAGQLISYYIYIWNLKTQGAWNKLGKVACNLFLYTPVVGIIWCLSDWDNTAQHLFSQENIPVWLILFGTAGQFTFTLRFIYQWWYSRKLHASVLPLHFWLISLIGSLMIITYAIIRKDPVLILGQSTGLIVYVRNSILSVRSSKEAEKQKT